MTVKELIESLKKCPLSATVQVSPIGEDSVYDLDDDIGTYKRKGKTFITLLYVEG